MLPSNVRQTRRSPIGGLAARFGHVLGLVLVTYVMAAPAQAQQTGRITGTVTNAASTAPLAGAQVIVDGTGIGTVTNNRGRFVLLNVPAGAQTVSAQLIGYGAVSQDVTVQAGSSVNVNFELRTEAIALEGVVATGTPGQARRREVGNSISQLSSEQLEANVVTSMGNALQGTVAGAAIMSNSGMVGAGTTIRLRGNNSITGGGSPLIYVDGVRMNSGSYASDPETNQAPTPFDDINPADIERIEVVKGAAATTLYGTEAANGVVQIFTKSGAAGAPRWTLGIDQGFNNLGHIGPESDPTGLGVNDCSARPGCPESGTWLHNGYVQKYNLSVRGGADDVAYFLSANWGDTEGVVGPQGMSDWGVRGNFQFRPTDDLTIRFNNSYKRRDITWIPSGNNAEGFMLNVLRGEAGYTPDHDNSLVFDMKLGQEVQHATSGLNITWNAMDGMVHRINAGIDWTNDDFSEERPWGFWYVPDGNREVDQGNERNLTLDYTGSWNVTGLPGELSSTFSWGGQLYDEYRWGMNGFGDDFAGPGDKVLESAAIPDVFETRRRTASGGFFLQEQIGWQDRLFVTAGARWDGFSTFGSGFGLALYPKLAAAYTISDHAFWPAWWETMKLRAAVGESGKAPDEFASERIWFSTTGDENRPAVSIQNLGNPDLGPERTREYEFGFDGSLYDGRVSYEFTHYRQRTYDGLVDVPNAPSFGTEQAVQRNIGEFKNWGSELSVNVSVLRQRDLSWDVGGRLSTSKSKVVNLGGLERIYIGWRNEVRPCADTDDPSTDYMNEAEDCPIPGFYHYVVTNPDAVGEDPEFDFRYIGPTYPTHTYGINTTVTVGQRLTFHVLGEGQGGNVLSSGVAHQNVRRGAWPPCFEYQTEVDGEIVFDPSRADEVTALQRAQCDPNESEYGVWTLPADFFKLRSASVSYRLPDNFLPPGAGSATIQLSGRNLFTSTDWVGLDPEIDEDGADGFSRQEYYQLPSLRTFMMNLRVNF